MRKPTRSPMAEASPRAPDMVGPPPNEYNADQDAWDQRMVALSPEKHEALIKGWVALFRKMQAENKA